MVRNFYCFSYAYLKLPIFKFVCILIVIKYTGCLQTLTMGRKCCVTNCYNTYDND